jgi:septal ring-binding cell division protein DamX
MDHQELFKEFDQPKKKRRKKAQGSILPKSYILFNVSHEQVVFTTIGVIMLMVLLFSLGVERGKRITQDEGKADLVATVKAGAEAVTLPEAAEAQPDDAVIAPEAAAAEEKKAEKEIEKPPAAAKNAGAPHYTIQVIAYRSKKSAKKELMQLTKKGYKPFIVVGGGYYQICVGEYPSHTEAQADFDELKKEYKDGFIRKR